MNSFRAAATALHLSQPAISRRIEKLEAALGIRLFERTTRRIALTAVGRDFSHKIRSLLDGINILGNQEPDIEYPGNPYGVFCRGVPARPCACLQYHGKLGRNRPI
jgi:hypothetical protein